MIGPITYFPKDQLGTQRQGTRARLTPLFFAVTLPTKQTDAALEKLKDIVIPLPPNPSLSKTGLGFTPPTLDISLVDSVVFMTQALRQLHNLRTKECYIAGSRTYSLLLPHQDFESNDVDMIAYVKRPDFSQIEGLAIQFLYNKIVERIPIADKLRGETEEATHKAVKAFIENYYLYKRMRFPRHDLPMNSSGLTDKETGSYYVCIGPDFVFAHDLQRRYVVSDIDGFRIGYDSGKLHCMTDNMFCKDKHEIDASIVALQNRQCRIIGNPSTVFGLIFQIVKLALKWTVSNLQDVLPVALEQFREHYPVAKVEKDSRVFTTRFHLEQQNHVSKSEPEAWRLLHFLNCLFLILQGKDEGEKKTYVSALATAWMTHPEFQGKQALARTLKAHPEQAHSLQAIVQGAFLYESLRHKSSGDVTYRPEIHFSLYRMHSRRTFHLLTNQPLHVLAESFAQAWLQLEGSFKDHSILTKILQELNMTDFEFKVEGKTSVARILLSSILPESVDLKRFVEWLGANISRLDFPNETEEKEFITYMQAFAKDDERKKIQSARSQSVLAMSLQLIIQRLSQKMRFGSLKSAQEISLLSYKIGFITRKFHKKIVEEIDKSLPAFAKQSASFLKELVDVASQKLKKLHDSQNQDDVFKVLSLAADSPHCDTYRDSLTKLYIALASYSTVAFEKCTQLGQQLFQAMEKLSKESQSLPKLLLQELHVALETKNAKLFRIIFAVFQSLQETQKIAAKETLDLSLQLESAKDISQIIPNFLQIIHLVDPKIEHSSKQAFFKMMAPKDREEVFVSLLKKQIEDKDIFEAYATWEYGSKILHALKNHVFYFALQLLPITQERLTKKLLEFVHQTLDEMNEEMAKLSLEQREKISHSLTLTVISLSQSQQTFSQAMSIYTQVKDLLLSPDQRFNCLLSILTKALVYNEIHTDFLISFSKEYVARQNSEQETHLVCQLLGQMVRHASVSGEPIIFDTFAHLLNSPTTPDVWNSPIENLTMHFIRNPSQRSQLIDLIIQKNLFAKMSQDNQDTVLKFAFEHKNDTHFKQNWALFEKVVPAYRLPYRYAFQHLSDSAVKATSAQVSQYIQEAQRLWKMAAEFLAPHDKFFARRVIVDLLLQEKNEPSLLEASKHLLDVDSKENVLKECATLMNRCVQLPTDQCSLALQQQMEKMTTCIFRYPIAKVSTETRSILESFIHSISKENPPKYILDSAFRFLCSLSNGRKEGMASSLSERTLMIKLTRLFVQTQQYHRLVFFDQVAEKVLKGKQKENFEQIVEKLTDEFFSMHTQLSLISSETVIKQAAVILPLYRKNPDKGRDLLEHIVHAGLKAHIDLGMETPLRHSISRLLISTTSLPIFSHVSLKGRTLRPLNDRELLQMNLHRRSLENIVIHAFLAAKEPGVEHALMHLKRYVSFSNLGNYSEVTELMTQLFRMFVRCLLPIAVNHSTDCFHSFNKFYGEVLNYSQVGNYPISFEVFTVTVINIIALMPSIIDCICKAHSQDPNEISKYIDQVLTKKAKAAEESKQRDEFAIYNSWSTLIKIKGYDFDLIVNIQRFNSKERKEALSNEVKALLVNAAENFVQACAMSNLYRSDRMGIIPAISKTIEAFKKM